MSLKEQISAPFSFREKTFTYMDLMILKECNTVKTYLDKNNEKCSLLKDDDGTFYLYVYVEEMGLPDDKINEFFFIVESEKEADLIHDHQIGTLQIKPHIHVLPHFVVKVKN